MSKLETVGISFVCDDVMEQCIKYDLVDVAKRIVNNRWHKITEKDEALAESINLRCNRWTLLCTLCTLPLCPPFEWRLC